LQYVEAVLDKDSSNAEAYFYAGTIYIISKNSKKGIEYLERSAALAPDNVRLRFILAETYEKLSLLAKAMDTYREVQKMAPDSREAIESSKRIHILLGRQYGEQGKFDEALQEFSSVLEKYPDDISALMYRGLTLSYMGRFDEAQTALAKALKIEPNNPQLHSYLAGIFEKKGEIEQAQQEYEQILRLVPKDSPLGMQAEVKLALINGAGLMAKGKFTDARHEFEKVLAIDPHNTPARFNLATVYHSMGDMTQAQDMLQSLIDDNPSNLEARLRLGTLHLELGKYSEAVMELEDVISMKSESPQAKQAANLLDTLRSKEKGKQLQGMTADERIALYKALLEQNSDDRQVWMELGLLYGQLRRQDEEREAFENVIRLDPNDPRALATLGGLYEDSEMYDKALELYQTALKLEKDPARKRLWENQLSIVEARKAFAAGKIEDAEEQFKKISAVDKDNYIPHFYLALIYSTTGRLDQAIREYKEVLRIVPGHLGARLNLAVAYEQVGREEEAITEYQAVARSGAPGLSDTAKSRLKALMKRVGGFSYNLNYYLDFDSNSNLSLTNPVQELISTVSASIVYRRKVQHKKIYWGLRFAPTYSVYHRQQFDFLQTDFNPFIKTTWLDTDFSWNYSYSQTDSVLVKKNYNTSNTLYMEAVHRFKMRSLLPFLTSDEQRKSTPSVWRINGNFRNFKSDTSPIYDSNLYSLGALINQGSTSGWSWTASYTYTNNNNLKPIGNDFAYSGHGINFQLSKSITPKLNASGSYGFIYTSYKNPDSVTRFTEYRINKFHSMSAGLNYTVNETLTLYSNLAYQRNNSNLPTGFILSSEDASTLIGIQSPSLGDYHKYTVIAGISLNF